MIRPKLFTVFFLHSYDINIFDILLLYYDFGPKILQERLDFRGTLNLAVQNRCDSNQILKTGSGSDLTLKN